MAHSVGAVVGLSVEVGAVGMREASAATAAVGVIGAVLGEESAAASEAVRGEASEAVRGEASEEEKEGATEAEKGEATEAVKGEATEEALIEAVTEVAQREAAVTADCQKEVASEAEVGKPHHLEAEEASPLHSEAEVHQVMKAPVASEVAGVTTDPSGAAVGWREASEGVGHLGVAEHPVMTPVAAVASKRDREYCWHVCASVEP